MSFADYAPTILEAARLRPAAAMTGRSFLDVLVSGKSGRVDRQRTRAFSAMERHAYCRPGNLGYPMRSLRTYEYRYIWNAAPERGPAGVPQAYGYGEIDNGPTKTFILEHKDSAEWGRFFTMSCGERPAEELYDLKKDPHELRNVAGGPGLCGGAPPDESPIGCVSAADGRSADDGREDHMGFHPVLRGGADVRGSLGGAESPPSSLISGAGGCKN